MTPPVIYECGDHHRAEITARFSVLSAVAPQVGWLADWTGRSLAIAKAVSDFHYWAHSKELLASPQGPVGELANRWSHGLEQAIPHRPRDDTDRRFETVLRKVVEGVSQLPSDDPLGVWYHELSDVSATLYGDTWCHVPLVVDRQASHPGRTTHGRDDYAMTLVTKPLTVEDGLDKDLEPKPGTPPPKIVLNLYTNTCGPETFAALPRGIFHELICHVGARHLETRDQDDNESIFAEGFMDWAAGYFFDAWSQRVSLSLGAAARYHGQQMMRAAAERSREGRAREEGLQAAENLVGWISNLESGQFRNLMKPHAAQAKVAKLAILVNQSQRPLPLKEEFVRALLGPEMPQQFVRNILDWLNECRDISEFLDAFC